MTFGEKFVGRSYPQVSVCGTDVRLAIRCEHVVGIKNFIAPIVYSKFCLEKNFLFPRKIWTVGGKFSGIVAIPASR